VRAQVRTTIPAWRTPAGGILSGLLFALAFPPLEWVLLLPLALVPWILALSAERSRMRALVSGFLFGLAYWIASIPWIFYVVTHYGGQSSVMGVVCVIILAAILAEWPAIVGWGVVAFAPSGSWRRLAVFPLLWMAAEHARSFVYGGFPWNLTGHALYRHPVWTQSASVWGVYGVGLAVTATATLLAASIGRRRVGPTLAAAVLTLLLGAGGAVRLATGNRQGGAPLSVAVLQPNLSQESRLAPGGSERNYLAVIGAAQAAASEKASLIVIPESAFPTYWDRSETMRRDISEIAGESGGAVLFNDIEEEPDGRYYNVARLAGPQGLLGKPYRKVHLVPFGEYVPLPGIFFFVRQVSTEIGAFSAAERPSTIVSGALSVGVGVCYEILYPSLAREEVARGANLLATISNDSWYGRAGAQPQHFAGAVLRAVENNRYLLRAAITGISGIVDEKGRIRQELPENRPGLLRGNVRLFDARTVWTRWGYWWLPRLSDGAALAVLLLGMARLFGSREPRADG
jgi:apolipoprotein N-acyltransferase